MSPIAPRIGGASALEQPPRIGRDRAEALVDLEQHRGARRGPDPGVRLDQPPLLRSSAFSGRLRSLTSTCAPPFRSSRCWSVVQRVTVADLLRIVGVEDAAAGRPDLDAHDRAAAEHSADHRVVDRRHGVAAAGEEPVAHRRLDDVRSFLARASASAASPRRSQPSAGRSSRRRRPRRSPPSVPTAKRMMTDRVEGAAEAIAALGEPASVS